MSADPYRDICLYYIYLYYNKHLSDKFEPN